MMTNKIWGPKKFSENEAGNTSLGSHWMNDTRQHYEQDGEGK